MSVKDYHTEADLNLSIAGISVAEGCAPGGINDAIRQLMADVKEEQDERKASEGALSASISSLETELDDSRSALEAELAKKLNLSGGTISGNVKYAIANIVQDKNGLIRVFVFPHDVEHAYQGGVLLRAYQEDGSTFKDFLLMPDGTASLSGVKVLTSAGGTLNGPLMLNSDVLAQRSTRSSYLRIIAGPGMENTPRIDLHGGEASTLPGSIRLTARNTTGSCIFEFFPDGRALANNKPVLCVESWRDGSDWYRKYSDGWIEQGGSVAKSTGTFTVPTNIPFETTTYFATGIAYSTSSTAGSGMLGVLDKQKTSFKLRMVNANNEISTPDMRDWYACGY